MKRVLRRTVSVLCALALTASCLTASMFVSAATDLAEQGATAFIDAVHASWATEPSTMLDGEIGDKSRWQSGNSLKNVDSFFGVYWDSEQTFNTVEIQ